MIHELVEITLCCDNCGFREFLAHSGEGQYNDNDALAEALAENNYTDVDGKHICSDCMDNGYQNDQKRVANDR